MDAFARKLEAAKRASTAHLLIKCARLVNEQAIASLPKDGPRPRPAHMSLFAHIPLSGGARITDIAERVGRTKQAVSQLVDDLEGMGMLSREPDPTDARAKRVVFTEFGRQSMLDGLAHLKSVDTALARAAGKDTMRSLHAALLALHDYLDPA